MGRKLLRSIEQLGTDLLDGYHVNKPKPNTFTFASRSRDLCLLLCSSFQHLTFRLTFNLSAGPECSRNFTSSGGVIKSPGFPEKYPNNLDCTFMIFAPKMSEIILEFENFDLEPDPTPPVGVFCRYDRLEIWDGFPGGEPKSLPVFQK